MSDVLALPPIHARIPTSGQLMWKLQMSDLSVCNELPSTWVTVTGIAANAKSDTVVVWEERLLHQECGRITT